MSSTKRKAPPVRIAKPQTTRNAKPMAKARINESRTAVVSVPKHQQKAKLSAGESIDISSDESDDEAADVDGGEDELMDDDEPADSADEPKTNGHANGTKNNEDDVNGDVNDDHDDDEDHEPTFGDLVREHETVDVTAALNQLNSADEPADATGRSKTNAAVAAAPTLASLGHLLNAALRSGDDANLEVCFNTTTDAVWIRNTIQRLDPSLAGALLQKLAARIHRRPGRAHTLVGWVQWTLITHGGALLANQAGVTRALQELHRVLEERARGLNSLLLLKGKLDMLEAQMQLRRVQRAGVHAAGGGHSGVATVGGRSGSSKALDGVNGLGRRGAGGRRRNGGGLGRGARDVDDEEEFVATYREEDDVEEDVAGQILVNGAGVAGESFIAESDEEALDDDDDEDSEGDEDDDAEDDDDLEEMDDDAAEDDEVDFDDVDDEDDEDDDDDDDAAAAPPPKLQKKSGAAFSKRR